MPRYLVERDDGVPFQIDVDHPLTDDELADAIRPEPLRAQGPVLGPAAIRGAGGLAGMFGPVAGAAGGGLSELMAELLAGEPVSKGRIGVAAGAGVIPGLNVLRGASLPVRAGVQALSGGVQAGGQAALDERFRTGEFPTPRSLLVPTVTGAGLGAVLGARQGNVLDQAAALRQAAQPGGPTVVTPNAPPGPPPTLPGSASGLPGVQGLADPSSGTVPVSATPGEIVDPRVKIERAREVHGAAVEDVAKTADALAQANINNPGRKLYLRVAEILRRGEINSDDLVNVLQKNGMSMEQFVNEYAGTIRDAGRQLQLMSALRRRLNVMARADPDLQKALDFLGTEPTTWTDRVADTWVKIDDVRRASLVTQLGTTARNVITQSGRYGLDVIDRSYQELLGGAPVDSAKVFGRGIASFFRAAKPSTMREIANVMDSDPLSAARLLRSGAGEVTLGAKYTRAINILNRGQEQFFQRAGFDQSLRTQLEAAGIDVADALKNPAKIPSGMIEKATEDALEITFAAPATGRLGREFMKGWGALPFRVLSTQVLPFPRFFVNGYKFLTDFSPAGYVKLMGPEAARALQDPARAQQILSRAHIGTGLLAAGLALRMSEHRGPKWWETVDPQTGRVTDWRAYSPFSTFLFYGEMMRQMSEKGTVDPRQLDFTTQEWLQGLTSISRIAGTGLVAVDVLRAQSAEERQRIVADLVGQYVGGFTVPFRTAKDFIAGTFDEDEAAFRETREPVELPVPGLGAVESIAAPAMANIPGLSQRLPEVFSPLRSGRLTAAAPDLTAQLPFTGTDIPATIAKQFGLTAQRDMNPLELAVAQLKIPSNRIRARTGIGAFDRLVAQAMAPVAEAQLIPLVQSPEFQQKDPLMQKIELLDGLHAISRAAYRVAVQLSPPETVFKLKARQWSPEIRELLGPALAEAGVSIR
jgi:hypothetical protein